MTWLVPIALASSLIDPQGPRTAAEFASLMRELHRETKSVCFIFEGEMSPLERGGGIKSGRQPILFQGLYALRPGWTQAGMLEVYESEPTRPPRHYSRALFNFFLEQSERPIDPRVLDPKTKKPVVEDGGPGSLTVTPSPEWFSCSWYFSEFCFRDYPGMAFENLGWDDVDGHRCLKVKLGLLPGSKPSPNVMIYWIDLDRGGHPLKIENYLNGKLLSRTERIELAKVSDVSGKNLWVPLKGEFCIYGSLASGIYQDYPMARETYGVVLGSLQLNLNLPDSAFVVHTKPRTELGNAVSLKRDHPIEVQPKKVERPKTDPASVKARLDAKLAEADLQATEVRASSPAREPWNMVVVLQAAIALVGVIAIVSAVVWNRRRS
jgi:hypothetical protein